MTKWEYCSLSYGNTGIFRVYKKDKANEERVHFTKFYQKIAELGEEGWELVCKGAHHELTFKRPIN